MSGLEMMLQMDLAQNHWHRIFGLNGRLSLVLLELAGFEATKAIEYLTPIELERFALFTYAKRRQEWLGGRIAAKQAAMSVAWLDEGDAIPSWLALEVAADPDGRPFLRAVGEAGRSLPDISISHSRGLAAAMAAGEGRCGVDIQKVTPSVLKIQKKFAAPPELDILDDLAGGGPEADRLTLLWAAKEALKKAIGTKTLPGFLGIRLAGITTDHCATVGDYFVFDFTLPDGSTSQGKENTVSVAVLFYKGYGLAFTGMPKRYI